MTTCAYLKPASLSDALAARAAHPDYLLLAGGTDVMVGSHHRPEPPGVIDLFGCEGLAGVEDEGDAIRIASGTTYAQLLRSDLVREHFPALHACAQEVGAVQIQERGTLGGNMATSSPVGDTLPVLLALDAVVVLGSPGSERRVPYARFCTGYRQVDLRPDELIVAVELPRPAPGLRQFWRKVGTRRAQAISKVMVAAAARLEGGTIAHVRLAMGAVADRPIRLSETEALLQGQTPSPELAERVRAQVRREIEPISDVRSTKDYRLTSAANLAARFVGTLV
ncbi:MAG: xanthine dehydrogenase family protein subunit M [Planctomycetota bacterium]